MELEVSPIPAKRPHKMPSALKRFFQSFDDEDEEGQDLFQLETLESDQDETLSDEEEIPINKVIYLPQFSILRFFRALSQPWRLVVLTLNHPLPRRLLSSTLRNLMLTLFFWYLRSPLLGFLFLIVSRSMPYLKYYQLANDDVLRFRLLIVDAPVAGFSYHYSFRF